MTQSAPARVVEREAAWELLRDANFLRRWRDLAASCGWATPFQESGFVTIWYSAYREVFAPLIVYDVASDGELNGLMTLAVDRNHRLAVAGGRQAEYQVWLARAGYEASFPRSVFAAIRPRLSGADFTVHYVPALTPLDWMNGARMDGLMVRVLEASRPLIVVGSEADAAESFKKKSNRSRLNRLARGGSVVFERMKTPDELRPFMKDIAAVYDVRQGALGADPPFLSDPRKAQFHLDLLNTADLLHASILRVDNTFVAGHLGMMGRGVVSVGVLAHSPFFAAHSPGKLLMMFLTQQLAREGFAALDLTPGGDQWKERFADRHEVVRKLTISSTGVAGAPRRVAEGTLVLAGKALRAVGVSPSRVRALVNSAEESGIPNVLKVAWRQAISGAYYRSEIRAYRLPLQNVPANPSQHIKRDALEDLALFRRAKGSSARAAFFKNVLMRLELGHHIYTRTEGGRLVAWSWFVERPERVVMEEVHQEFVYPPNSGEIGAFFTEPDVRGRGYSRQCVEQMIRDAAHAGLEQLYAFVPGHNRACCHLLEQSGFSPVARLFERRFLGRSETGHSLTDATAGRIGPVQEKDVSSGDRVPEAPRPDR